MILCVKLHFHLLVVKYDTGPKFALFEQLFEVALFDQLFEVRLALLRPSCDYTLKFRKWLDTMIDTIISSCYLIVNLSRFQNFQAFYYSMILLRLRSEISLPIMRELVPHYLQEMGKVCLECNVGRIMLVSNLYFVYSYETIHFLIYFCLRKVFTFDYSIFFLL